MAEETETETEHETETVEEPHSDHDDIRAIIREEIAKALKSTPRTRTTAPGVSRTGTIEREAREAVEREAARLTKEKEHESEHDKLKAEKEEPEKVPVKMRRLTKALWGSNE